MSRFTASVGPLEQPPVEWKARISASHALTVRARRDSSATPTPSDQRYKRASAARASASSLAA
jgi:hypothetical protein